MCNTWSSKFGIFRCRHERQGHMLAMGRNARASLGVGQKHLPCTRGAQPMRKVCFCVICFCWRWLAHFGVAEPSLLVLRGLFSPMPVCCVGDPLGTCACTVNMMMHILYACAYAYANAYAYTHTHILCGAIKVPPSPPAGGGGEVITCY